MARNSPNPKPVRTASTRCAIYTRKSSEDGLEQEFNSLDAQREACLAYITSQRHEGWKALPTHYDDGVGRGASRSSSTIAAASPVPTAAAQAEELAVNRRGLRAMARHRECQRLVLSLLPGNGRWEQQLFTCEAK
jgi:hypothetical protein